MKDKIEKLLAQKRLDRKKLNLDFANKPYTSTILEENYSLDMDRIETEIELLELILKD